MSRMCPHCGKSLTISNPTITESERRRFWERVKKLENGCWEWQSKNTSEIYGRFKVGKYSMVAHRVAYLLTYGSIEDGKILMHTCDFPRCVNPEHLKIGTDSDNMVDMVEKGRGISRKGSSNYQSKHTDEDVLQIKTLLSQGKPIKEVAAQFNVTFQSIYQIGRGLTWTHIAPELGQQIQKRLYRHSPEKIAEIRRLWGEEGMLMQDIATKFDMWRVEVSKIVKGIPKGNGLPHWPGRPRKVIQDA